MTLGMNDASSVLWLQLLPRRVYRFGKFALKASLRGIKNKNNSLPLQPLSSIHEIHSAAIKGFPIKLSDFKKLKQPYKAYDMLGTS
jgi:hypothetical protein